MKALTADTAFVSLSLVRNASSIFESKDPSPLAILDLSQFIEALVLSNRIISPIGLRNSCLLDCLLSKEGILFKEKEIYEKMPEIISDGIQFPFPLTDNYPISLLGTISHLTKNYDIVAMNQATPKNAAQFMIDKTTKMLSKPEFLDFEYIENDLEILNERIQTGNPINKEMDLENIAKWYLSCADLDLEDFDGNQEMDSILQKDIGRYYQYANHLLQIKKAYGIPIWLGTIEQPCVEQLLMKESLPKDANQILREKFYNSYLSKFTGGIENFWTPPIAGAVFSEATSKKNIIDVALSYRDKFKHFRNTYNKILAEIITAQNSSTKGGSEAYQKLINELKGNFEKSINLITANLRPTNERVFFVSKLLTRLLKLDLVGAFSDLVDTTGLGTDFGGYLGVRRIVKYFPEIPHLQHSAEKIFEVSFHKKDLAKLSKSIKMLDSLYK